MAATQQIDDEIDGVLSQLELRRDQELASDGEAFFRRYHFRRSDAETRASVVQIQREHALQDAAITAMALLKLIPISGKFCPEHNFYLALIGALLIVLVVFLFGLPSLQALIFGRAIVWLGAIAAGFGAISVHMVFIQPWWMQRKLLRTGQQ